MFTLISYPNGMPWIQTSRAYCQLDSGEVWGPLWPYVSDELSNDHIKPRIMDFAGDTLEAAMANILPGWVIEMPELQAGQHYPRIWRAGEAFLNQGDSIPRVFETPFFDSFIGSLEQIESLFDSLSSVFHVAHPHPNNLSSYGGAIRDLIILACTEVEAQWKGILKANNVSSPSDRYSTTNYVRLLPIMRLDEYKVQLTRYPELQAIAPFQGWDAARPTQSLVWYDAYNRVKHDREANFQDATLEHSIQAVAGCVVMLAAQYGERALRNYRFDNVFYFTKIPMWEPKHLYYGPIPRIPWQAVNCPI